MPFTFSHPAVLYPLKTLPGKYYSITGLIIGSITPDFEYFIRFETDSQYSHTRTGLFWFDLPLGIILAFIFHNIVRNDLVANLPRGLQLRFNNNPQFNWNQYFLKNW